MLYEVITEGIHQFDTLTILNGATLNNIGPGLAGVGATSHYAARITSYNVCYTKLLRRASRS